MYLERFFCLKLDMCTQGPLHGNGQREATLEMDRLAKNNQHAQSKEDVIYERKGNMFQKLTK